MSVAISFYYLFSTGTRTAPFRLLPQLRNQRYEKKNWFPFIKAQPGEGWISIPEAAGVISLCVRHIVDKPLHIPETIQLSVTRITCASDVQAILRQNSVVTPRYHRACSVVYRYCQQRSMYHHLWLHEIQKRAGGLEVLRSPRT
ncbi:hypothetical protein DFS33DRAFT_609539 [Desarmillaria ectypa]|nr:hypothetical protein DFS33DRAFT_609539 [Desarmillaria ectypa]